MPPKPAHGICLHVYMPSAASSSGGILSSLLYSVGDVLPACMLLLCAYAPAGEERREGKYVLFKLRHGVLPLSHLLVKERRGRKEEGWFVWFVLCCVAGRFRVYLALPLPFLPSFLLLRRTTWYVLHTMYLL